MSAPICDELTRCGLDGCRWCDPDGYLARIDLCPDCQRRVCKCPSLDDVPYLPSDSGYIGEDGRWHPPESGDFSPLRPERDESGHSGPVTDRSDRNRSDSAPGPTGDEPASSWHPVDLAAVLDGTWTPAQPTVGRRGDGHGLLYPGRVHTIAGESEAGKGWFMVALTVTELIADHGIVYVDFEDEVGAVVGRMLAAGATPDQLRTRFAYIRPEGPISAIGRGELTAAIGDLHPAAVLLDGVTEAMGLHGLDPLKNAEVATFGRMLPRWIADRGPAVLASDHVTKNSEGRGRYALGAVHKLNGVDGAAYLIDNRRPFGIGMTGRSTLMLAKDRPGALRQHARPSGAGLWWYADLVLASRDATFVEIDVSPPGAEPAAPFRPTVLMRKVSDALTRAGTPLSGRDIQDRVTGKAADIRTAVAVLVDEGYVVVEDGKRNAKLHRLVQPYEGDQ
jgi:hypothetical protein